MFLFGEEGVRQVTSQENGGWGMVRGYTRLTLLSILKNAIPKGGDAKYRNGNVTIVSNRQLERLPKIKGEKNGDL